MKTIRIHCDCEKVEPNALIDKTTNEIPVFVCSDSAEIEVVFLENGKLKDVSDFTKAELYLKDLGENGKPPASDGLNYFIKEETEIDANLHFCGVSKDRYHLAFSLSDIDTNIARGYHWLSIVYYAGANKTTFVAGKVLFVPSGTENKEVANAELQNLQSAIFETSQVCTTAKEVCEKSVQTCTQKVEELQDIADIINVDNLNAISKKVEDNAQTSIEAKEVCLQTKEAVITIEQNVIGYDSSASQHEHNSFLYSKNAETSETACKNYLNEVELVKSDVEEINSEVQLAKAEAIDAKNRAVEIADPNGVITSVQKDNVELKLDKVNRGELCLNNGYFAKTSGNRVDGLPLSFVGTFSAKWSELTSTPVYLFSNCQAVTQGVGFYVQKSGTNFRMFVNYYDPTNKGSNAYKDFPMPSDNERITLGFIFNNTWLNNSTGRIDVKFICKNQIEQGSVSSVSATSLAYTGANGYACNITKLQITGLSSAISTFPIQISRYKLFNFDMSEADAPYTIADYQTGKDEPPSLHDTSSEKRAFLSLQDYTLTNGTTKQILDASGNANDATITGNVQGTNDVAVGRLVDFIVAQAQG